MASRMTGYKFGSQQKPSEVLMKFFNAHVGKSCKEHNVPLTVHVGEASRDRELIRESYEGRPSPVEFCERTHITGSRTVLAHTVHLDLDKDLDILQRTLISVVHNPTSNFKLADGVAPIPQMLAKEINVALGSDGAPCSNTYDLFRDMHLTAILHKAVTEDPSQISAEQTIKMATINGARALGLDAEIGSLETGKKAEFAVVNPGGLGSAPYDTAKLGQGTIHPPTIIVHSSCGSDVVLVVVDGKEVVRDGILLTADEEDIKRLSREAARDIRSRTELGPQPLKRGWNYV